MNNNMLFEQLNRWPKPLQSESQEAGFFFYAAHIPQKQMTPFVSDQESNIECQCSLCTLAEQVRPGKKSIREID
jgi:hypothetical protein